ncbi:pimeloyl-ACP methyl ester carboxylesterase [Saccharomonospora amisosensis]|uniref:Pimeloyl-ACP methyl ester carboxylesterase n=1 Tax=Saccharomonospora amisosensis TaxID=1128677 RepID=A0A7X5UN88_9PSEU|nr:alpha/beta fold hydrolase [Saccharomonospora amisosensis]NIJ11135.1 pimeloyl-ACP methyl ester carboxylesterase [Saccharomonospora amisosensis]
MTDTEPVLLLLHGLGANRHVWRGLERVLTDRWPGECVTPDLPGHGEAPALSHYSFGRMAAEVADTVAGRDRVVVLGHSLGGALALTLASGWFGVGVSAVCGLGIKLRWSAEELARAAQFATRPQRVLPDRAEAASRWLRGAGLAGLAGEDGPEVAAGIAETDGGWRLTVDQRAFAVGAPDMTGLLSACRASVVLAAGESDPMCPAAHLREHVNDPVVLAGLGHNAHVQDPSALLPLLDRLAEAAR